jgi:hypothetical protein
MAVPDLWRVGHWRQDKVSYKTSIHIRKINRLAVKKYKRANPQKTKVWKKKYQKNHLGVFRKSNKRLFLKYRRMVLDGYGAECACCGENNIGFLSIDHIKNNGAVDRRRFKGSPTLFYRWLINNNFPKQDYRLLCYNCNIGRHHNNFICPHMKSYRYH